MDLIEQSAILVATHLLAAVFAPGTTFGAIALSGMVQAGEPLHSFTLGLTVRLSEANPPTLITVMTTMVTCPIRFCLQRIS